MSQLGYTRVSTAGQDAQLQLNTLRAAGVQKRDIFANVTSGSRTALDRPGMRRLLATLYQHQQQLSGNKEAPDT